MNLEAGLFYLLYRKNDSLLSFFGTFCLFLLYLMVQLVQIKHPAQAMGWTARAGRRLRQASEALTYEKGDLHERKEGVSGRPIDSMQHNCECGGKKYRRVP